MQWILILKAVLESVHHADYFEYKVDYVKGSNNNFEFSPVQGSEGGWDPPRGRIQTLATRFSLRLLSSLGPIATFQGVTL